MGKSISKNFIYNSVYQIAAIIIPIITTPYLSRVLGANGIGEYGYELSVASYFMLCIKLGLNNYGNRKIAAVRDDKVDFSINFWGIYSLQIITTIIFSGLYILYAFTISHNTVISAILTAYVVSSGIDITWFYWGLEEFKYIAIRDFTVKISTTVCIFLLVKTSNDVWKYTVIMSAGALCSQLFLWLGLNRKVLRYRPKIDEILSHVKPNLILFIPVIAVSLYNTMDKIMLGIMTNSSEVGFYESSEKILRIPVALVTSLGTVMLPRMSNIYATVNDETSANQIIEKSMLFAIFLSTSLGFGIMTVAKEFVPLFYGHGFGKCVSLFMILLPSCIFMSLANVIRTQYLIPKKMDKIYLISVFIGAGTNLIFNYIFIPSLQSVGAALGTFIAEASVCLVQSFAVSKKIPLKKYVYKCIPLIISGMIMFTAIHPISFSRMGNMIELVTKIVIAGLIYLIALAVTITMVNIIRPGTYDYKTMFIRIKTNNNGVKDES